MNVDAKKIKEILIINLGGIGDLLLSVPALKAIRKKFIHARISLMIVPGACGMVKNMPCIDEIFLFDIKFGVKEIWNNLKILAALRKKGFDLAVNMRTLVSKTSALKMKLLLKIIGSEIKAGRNTQGRGKFFDLKIGETDLGDKYEMDYDIEMAQALGAEVIDRELSFDFSEQDLLRVKRLLEDNGIYANDTIIGINPGGKRSRRWPVENFIKTIEKINEHHNCKFVITGVAQESGLAGKIKTITGINIINLVNRLNLQELGALIKTCRLYISNDTGPMHIAAILKTPLVAIFGPGHLRRFDPRNISDKAVVLQEQTACAPCNKAYCRDLFCLKRITPEKVIEASLNLLT